MSQVREPSQMSPKNFCLEKALHAESVGQVRSLNPITRDIKALMVGTGCWVYIILSLCTSVIMSPKELYSQLFNTISEPANTEIYYRDLDN